MTQEMPRMAPFVLGVPVNDQPFIGGHAPEHIEDGRRHDPVLIGPIPSPGRHGIEKGLLLPAVGVDESRIERRAGLPRILRDMVEYLGCDGGNVFERHAGQFDPGLLLVPVHHGVPEPLLTSEIAVDGSLVDAGPFGHGPHGQLLPVTNRGAVQEFRGGDEDAFPRLSRSFAPERAVVRATLRERGLLCGLLGGAYGVHPARPAWPTNRRRPESRLR